MSHIRLKGSVRQICEKMLIIELEPESRIKLQHVLDNLPDTANVRTIHPSGSFSIRLTPKTKIISSNTKWDIITDIVGYDIDITLMYRYYKFISDDIVNDGYTFIATIIRL